MKLLYTHSNNLIVLNAKNLVESVGINVVLKNEFSAAACGELPPIDNWLELWIVEDMHYERAQEIISPLSNPPGDDWFCGDCNEKNGSAFDFCWSCSVYRPS